MSKKDKLYDRLKEKPKDYSWKELKKLLESRGFREIDGKGSRKKFFHEEQGLLINLHKPHPDNIIKEYVLKNVINTLETLDGIEEVQNEPNP